MKLSVMEVLLPQVSSNLDNQELKDKSSLLPQGSKLDKQKLKDKSRLDGLLPQGSNPSNLDSIGRLNDGNKEAQTQIIIFPRSTFHRICIQSSKPKAREGRCQ